MSLMAKIAVPVLLVVTNYWNVAGLSKDYMVLHEGIKAPVSRSYEHVLRPQCTVVNYFMLTYCDFVYHSVQNPGDHHSLMPIMFGSVRADQVYYVESARSGIVSTNYHLNHMVNRTISGLIFLLLSLLIVVALFTNDGEGSVERSTMNGRRVRY